MRFLICVQCVLLDLGWLEQWPQHAVDHRQESGYTSNYLCQVIRIEQFFEFIGFQRVGVKQLPLGAELCGQRGRDPNRLIARLDEKNIRGTPGGPGTCSVMTFQKK
ncbi:MAG: hypothetical protein ACR2KT_06245 [Methylocella sp.]